MKDRISPTLTKTVRDAGHAAGKQARCQLVSTPGCAAVAPSTARATGTRVDRAQAEMARAKGYRKGRGSNEGPAGRFELQEQVAFDDGWSSGQVRFEDLLSRPTTVSEDRAKSVLTFNQSPDPTGFDRSVNPYRGCEHGCTCCYARPSHAFMGLSAGLVVRNPAVCQVRRREAARRRPAQAELLGRADRAGDQHRSVSADRAGVETDGGGDRRARHLQSSDNHRHQVGRDPARSRSAGGHGRARSWCRSGFR